MIFKVHLGLSLFFLVFSSVILLWSNLTKMGSPSEMKISTWRQVGLLSNKENACPDSRFKESKWLSLSVFDVLLDVPNFVRDPLPFPVKPESGVVHGKNA